jgi:hypothetical protein
MANPSMPTHGHTTAPKFSPDQPCKLRRYFKELEVLFGSCNITAEPEMKKHACRYLDIDISNFWQSILEYGVATYANWKVAIYKLYPGSDDHRRWTMTDIHTLQRGCPIHFQRAVAADIQHTGNQGSDL